MLKRLFQRPFLLAGVLMFGMPAVALLTSIVPIRSISKFSVAKLAGVIQPAEAPITSLAAFADGSFQAKVGPWLAERMGRPRELYIRISNGLVYALGRSTVPSIVIGRDRTLFEVPYVKDWCVRSDVLDADALALRLLLVQTRLNQRGKSFVFVISPSKAALYPELLPPTCAPPAKERPYDILVPALAARGVHFVDGAGILKSVKATQPWPLFGRDGIHWNELGVAHVTMRILDALTATGHHPVGTLRIDRIKVDSTPFAEEGDLADLLNLPIDLPVYPSPHPVIEADPPAQKPRTLIVGSSFTGGLFRTLGLAGLIGPSEQYFYFSRIYPFDGVQFQRSDFRTLASDRIKDTLPTADTIILEANEANLTSPHVESFISAAIDQFPIDLRP